MKKIETSIYTNAQKHGDDVSKIIDLGDNAIAAIIADGVSGCTSGRVASSFLVHYIERYLDKEFKAEMGVDELEDVAQSSIESAAQELVNLNSDFITVSSLLQNFNNKTNELNEQFQNELITLNGNLTDVKNELNKKISEKDAYSKAHAKIKEISESLTDKRIWRRVEKFFASIDKALSQNEDSSNSESEQRENILLDKEIAELRVRISQMDKDREGIESKISSVNFLLQNITQILVKEESIPKNIATYDIVSAGLLKEYDHFISKVNPIIENTLNTKEKLNNISQKIQNDILVAIKKGESLLFKSNVCLAIIVNRKRKEKNEYRLYTFVLGDPEVRIISIRNKDNKEVYFKNSNSGLTSYITSDSKDGICGEIDFNSISVKENDYIIMASDGANIKYNKSSNFPYTLFINLISNYDKQEKMSDLSKSWYEKLEKENAITDDFSLIVMKVL